MGRFALVSKLLWALPNGRNIAGNDLPSFCVVPIEGAGNLPVFSADCYQISKTQSGCSKAAHGLHGERFNDRFHDGHVAIHRVTDTVGSAKTNSPAGMWTLTAGD